MLGFLQSVFALDIISFVSSALIFPSYLLNQIDMPISLPLKSVVADGEIVKYYSKPVSKPLIVI